jgi:mannose-6-phosphate isomerase-like protein (cupin superfamily)
MTNEITEPQLFQLRTQLLSKGRSDDTIAQTDLLSIRIKCYAQGGENVLHTHPGEDHAFVVLAGMAKFFGKNGEITVLTRNQGILLPRGCFYKFQSCGDEPLVMLRVGAQKEKLPIDRIGVEGNSLPGKSLENKHEDGVPIEGLYYE